MTVKKTSSYSQFRLVEGNRQLVENHVRALMASIGKRDLLESNPIIVDDEMRVIDGQHRLEAARRLGVSIYYTIVDGGASIEDVQLINSAQRMWSLRDYIHSFIVLGNDEYQRLSDFVEKWDIPISAAVRLLSGDSKVGLRGFKSGDFVIVNELKALEVMNMVKVFKPYITKNIRRSREFLNAISHIVEKQLATQEEMEDRLQAVGRRFYQLDTTKDYLRAIEDVYNFNRRGGKVRFY